ncbi:MAG: rhodanese-like domain-containing protein [Opitutales bacterium]
MSALRQASLLLLFSALGAVAVAWLHPRAPVYQDTHDSSPYALTAAEIREEGPEGYLWIDARTVSEYAEGHFPGSIHFDENDWEAGFNAILMAWDGAQPIVVYCAAEGCQASEAVATRLRRELGWEAVFFLDGGWAAAQEVRP